MPSLATDSAIDELKKVRAGTKADLRCAWTLWPQPPRSDPVPVEGCVLGMDGSADQASFHVVGKDLGVLLIVVLLADVAEDLCNLLQGHVVGAEVAQGITLVEGVHGARQVGRYHLQQRLAAGQVREVGARDLHLQRPVGERATPVDHQLAAEAALALQRRHADEAKAD
eukprot:CAMPEP_0113830860 /NCGR_PEP_ID=MMETSP0328-20130328/6553_1 /TAXON_ID=39455 /ORGANISM="Alexandrium minutum" /LENGTH=168 /DNA_ID=CAMNT_0000798999 /DNA_START=249 /DNA_END=752 /DNA_ORIENTATION=- /assembly_acc=CAM_ASM_000350